MWPNLHASVKFHCHLHALIYFQQSIYKKTCGQPDQHQLAFMLQSAIQSTLLPLPWNSSFIVEEAFELLSDGFCLNCMVVAASRREVQPWWTTTNNFSFVSIFTTVVMAFWCVINFTQQVIVKSEGCQCYFRYFARIKIDWCPEDPPAIYNQAKCIFRNSPHPRQPVVKDSLLCSEACLGVWLH